MAAERAATTATEKLELRLARKMDELRREFSEQLSEVKKEFELEKDGRREALAENATLRQEVQALKESALKERLQPSHGRCDKGHALLAYQVPSDALLRLICDGCEQSFAEGHRLHGCRTCDFDLCAPCVQARVPQLYTAAVKASTGSSEHIAPGGPGVKNKTVAAGPAGKALEQPAFDPEREDQIARRLQRVALMKKNSGLGVQNTLWKLFILLDASEQARSDRYRRANARHDHWTLSPALDDAKKALQGVDPSWSSNTWAPWNKAMRLSNMVSSGLLTDTTLCHMIQVRDAVQRRDLKSALAVFKTLENLPREETITIKGADAFHLWAMHIRNAIYFANKEKIL